MASLVYNSCLDDMARGAIDFDTDTFKTMLVTVTYTPDKDTHTKRSNVTNEVTGTGYVSGGAATAVTVAKNLATDKITITFGAVSWPSSTITAKGAVIYKSRGGASSADEIVCYIEFATEVSSINANFDLSASTINLQN